MTTRRARSLVSLSVALAGAIALAGCSSTPARLASNEAVPVIEPHATIRFDNAAHDFVRVYLVGQKWEWLLGRVEIGASATLRVPDAALAPDVGPVRLAVVEGQSLAVRVAGDPHATTTGDQPLATILSQRWRFAESAASVQLTSLRRDPRARSR